MINLKELFGKKISPPPFEDDGIIKISNSIFENNTFAVKYEHSDNPRLESFHGKNVVYLPVNYSNTHPLFNTTRKILGEDLLPKFTIYHEFGHAAQIARLPANFNNPVDIKGNINLNWLFNGGMVSNKINNFMKELFKEGFADCYAGLCLYKETGNLDVFNKISDIRAKRFPELKKENKKTVPAYFIHGNFNIKAAEYLGKTIASLVAQGQDVFGIQFVAPGAGQSLEKHIERAVIAGSVDALLRELRSNDACLNHFRSFAQGFKLDQYSVRRILAGNPHLNQILAYEQKQGISSYFLEMKNRLPPAYASILTDKAIEEILCNTKYQRAVDPNLTLMDVVDIPYSAGLEGVRSRVTELRSQHLNLSGKKAPKP